MDSVDSELHCMRDSQLKSTEQGNKENATNKGETSQKLFSFRLLLTINLLQYYVAVMCIILLCSSTNFRWYMYVQCIRYDIKKFMCECSVCVCFKFNPIIISHFQFHFNSRMTREVQILQMHLFHLLIFYYYVIYNSDLLRLVTTNL